MTGCVGGWLMVYEGDDIDEVVVSWAGAGPRLPETRSTLNTEESDSLRSVRD